MSEPILYYMPGTCALACIIALRWLDEPFRLCRVESADRRGPKFLGVNPLGRVPALRDGEFVLTESGAILNYLAGQKPAAGLLPEQGTQERARFDEWQFWFDSGFHIAFVPVFKTALFTDNEDLHPHLREMAVKQIEKAYQFAEDGLVGRSTFTGETPGLLDATFFAMSRWGPHAGVSFEDRYPGVLRQRERMLGDPAVKFALAIEAGEIKDADGSFRGHVTLE